MLIEKHWKAYEPSEEQPWNLPRVWMLHRRAGFGANWAELQRDLKSGHEEAVTRILAGTSRDVDTDEFESTAKHLLENAISSGQISRLSAWWILRMYLGPNAFAERRTLMWHNHFATSYVSIRNLLRMYRQNSIFRQFGDGEFGPLLVKAIKDPAMLLWLNANDNREGHPNENLGRELLELFSLGVGNYSEQDVKEAARALAGWTAMEMMPNPGDLSADPLSDEYKDRLKIRDHWKDPFDKTILGKTGNWDGNDLLKIVTEHPATAKRLAWRICDELFGEKVVSQEAMDALATGMVENNLDLEWAYKTVLKSELFFSAANLKTRIAPPETFVLGCLRALDTKQNPASTLALTQVFSNLGRSLFQPPNVGGWDGGRLWLNARTLVARSNFVHAVIHNGMNRTSTPPDFKTIVEGFEDNKDIESVVTQMAELLLGIDRGSDVDQKMIAAVVGEAKKQSDEAPWSHVAHLLLNSSSTHLC